LELDKFRDVDLVIDHINHTFYENQFVSQNDNNGRSLTVQFTNRGEIGEVPGLTVHLGWHNEASGLTDLSPFTLIDQVNSIFRIYYPNNMLTPGKVKAYIQIIQDGKVSNTKQFTITVQKLFGVADPVITRSEYGALLETLSLANKYKTEVDRLKLNKASNDELAAVERDLLKEIETLENEMKQLRGLKVDKGGASQVTWAMLAQDARDQITGDQAASVGQNSVTTESMVDYGVTQLKLERTLQDNLIDFVLQEVPTEMGFYSTYDSTYTVADNYYSIKTTVTPGDFYSCDTVVKGQYNATVHFFSDTNFTTYLSSLGSGSEEAVDIDDFRFIVPTGAQSMIISSYGEEPTLRMGEVVNTPEIVDRLKYYQKVDTEILTGFYSSLDTSWYANDVYRTAKYTTPTAGEKLFFSCNADTIYVAAIAFWRAEGDRISLVSGVVKEYEREEIAVPSGTTFVTVTSRIGTDPIIEKKVDVNVQDLNNDLENVKNVQEGFKMPKDSLYVKTSSNGIEVLSKYTDTKDLKRTLSKLCANQTVQLGNFYLIDNLADTVGTDFGDDSDVLYSQYTDMVAPWGGLRAVNNINGDQPGAGGYTGGWHAYDNANTGSPTARTDSIEFYLDDIKVDVDEQRYCKKAKVVVTNYIQGLNTKKSDGSGREILKETVCYEFTHDRISVTVEAEALEDITIEEYYFLQFQRTTTFRESFVVIGDEENSKRITDYAIDIYGSNTPDSQVIKMIFDGTDDVFEMSYDPTYGIGRLPYNTDSQSWHYRTYGKGYFDLIQSKTDPIDFEQGNIIHCRGEYKLYRKNTL